MAAIHNHAAAPGVGNDLRTELAQQGVSGQKFTAAMEAAETRQAGLIESLSNDGDGFTAAEKDAVAARMTNDIVKQLGVSDLSNGALMQIMEECRNCLNGVEAGVAARNGVELMQGSFTGGPSALSDSAAFLNRGGGLAGLGGGYAGAAMANMPAFDSSALFGGVEDY